MTYSETDVKLRLATLLDHAELSFPLTTAQTASFDQYHTGGAGAVDALIASLALEPGDTVIDVGCGFGGPARRVAERTGASVLGIDTSAAYVDAAQMLTDRSGLHNLVSFRHSDASTLDMAGRFDAAITMHVQMNIRDKPIWFAEIANLMAPGARLALWEVCTAGADLQPQWPTPWSIDGTDSFLITPDELLVAVTSAGLSALDWRDDTAWAVQWAATADSDRNTLCELTLPSLLDDGTTRVQNLRSAINDGTVRIVRGLFAKPTDAPEGTSS